MEIYFSKHRKRIHIYVKNDRNNILFLNSKFPLRERGVTRLEPSYPTWILVILDEIYHFRNDSPEKKDKSNENKLLTTQL